MEWSYSADKLKQIKLSMTFNFWERETREGIVGEQLQRGKRKKASWFHLLLEKFNVPNCNINAATLKENPNLLPLSVFKSKAVGSGKDKKGDNSWSSGHSQFRYDQRLASGNNWDILYVLWTRGLPVAF